MQDEHCQKFIAKEQLPCKNNTNDHKNNLEYNVILADIITTRCILFGYIVKHRIALLLLAFLDISFLFI